jgi:hypothetical protein
MGKIAHIVAFSLYCRENRFFPVSQFFRQKLSKIAENFDHTMTPGTDVMIKKYFRRKKLAFLTKKHC